ncbi:MAG: hypothetical protein COY80_04635 [Candidatus Pacebacteria bacterium CG_4_10_14_0_8_um_filter_42_14]|nr:MAG: hypothetical protein COY80_04635 [Candidatus Pacebacteria bacterium CG_4_10_14_0_8_um_filter_42_14]
MKANMRLSVVVQTKNAAKTLEKALQSVAFADELIVVDMESSDATREIALKFTDNVVSTKDVGYVEPARNKAIEKASGEWILLLDADEEISVSLGEKIETLVATESDVSCYFLPRKNIIFGNWVKDTGWWPDFQPRLFRAGTVTWKDEIHSRPLINGKTDKLPSDESLAIIHHNYSTVSEYIDRLNRYTSITAKFDSKEKSVTTAGLISSYRSELLRRLFLQGGIDGGYRSVLLSFLQANYELVVSAKKWEIAGRPEDDSTSITEMEKFNSELAYWIADWHTKKDGLFRKLFWKIRRKLRV